MSPEQDKLNEIFSEALAKASPEDRERYLAAACGQDADLRRQLDALLEAHTRAGDFLHRKTIALDSSPLGEGPGSVIGRYKLREQIGEGGCGVVYVAEQEEPVRRRVALKVIKLGMDTKSVVARFEAERQALAMMDHPNIAKVLDAGATETGRPYFVMELVRGIRITDYCDQNKLATRERLDLFMKVCQAVQHAHQKGIIHRDLKPSNILVTLHDGVPVPKVIDFGIAKATEGRLSDLTVYTELHQFIGTPAYMSPEQAEMSGLDIDTRSDIYSLGVLLYELLTGCTPFDAKELLAAGLDAMRRTIREEDPLRPSTKLNTLSREELTTTAQRRGIEAPKLIHLVRGDLDWIVMKSLEKDRTRRYDTANGLASDLRRFLANEPVGARPPTPLYRFEKMVRRNRSIALASAAVIVTLIFALVFSMAAFLRERKARVRAAAAEQAREEARRATEAETVRAESVARFLSAFFDGVVPDLYQHGQRESIRRLIDVAGGVVLDLTNAPLAEAQLRLVIATAYAEWLFEYKPALPHYRAVEQLASKLGPTGERLGVVARLHRLGTEMWEHRDANIAQVLHESGNAALNGNVVDLDTAAFAFGAVSEFEMWRGSLGEAENLARESLRVGRLRSAHSATPSKDLFFDPSGPLFYLVQLTSKRGALAEAEQIADELFVTLQVLPSRDEDQRRQRFIRLLALFSVGDWTRLPEASLRRFLQNLGQHDQPTQAFFQGLLGVAVARRGDWRAGLNLMQTAAKDSVNWVDLWYVEIQLAALLGESELQRSLSIEGLALFASQVNLAITLGLVVPLLVLEPDPAFLPILAKLVDQIQNGSPNNRVMAKFPLALMRYRTGQFLEAAGLLDEFFRGAPPDASFDSLRAPAWFLRAMLQMRMENVDAAREAYRQGLQFHSPALRGPGTPYTGDNWGMACTAELLRRQAAAVLGSAVPLDPRFPR